VQASLTELTSAGGIVQDERQHRVLVNGAVQVLATGSRYANALMRPPGGQAAGRLAFYQAFQARLAQAARVLIVGGGPIGVEVAGEISARHPDKALTLVEAGPRLLAGSTPALAARAAAVLAARGVRILTGERLLDAGSPTDDILAPGGEARTSGGQRLPYDFVIWCTGGRPATGYLDAHFGQVLDADRRVRVTPELRVEGFDRLFALGDITDLPENKMAWHVAGHVEVAEVNVRRVLAAPGGSPRLQAYRPQTGNPNMVVTLGPDQGVTHLRPLGLIQAGWFNRRVKAAHMLVPKYRKLLGV
jgi:NADH dehydrogenase FAD-containing subunit